MAATGLAASFGFVLSLPPPGPFERPEGKGGPAFPRRFLSLGGP
jgi:hypothetical protein